MATSHFRQFLGAATGPAPGTESLLRPGCLYGLRASWCLAHVMTAKHDASFRNGMLMCRINVRDGRLGMQHRAAPACIFTGYPRAA